VLAIAVLGSLLWLGLAHALARPTYSGIVALVWAVMLVVVWFQDGPKGVSGPWRSWLCAIFLDIFIIAAVVLAVRGA
jgi:hypothetical protein